MSQKDALGRSLPWATHKELDEKRPDRFIFTGPDFLMFEFIDRHGYMPSNYLRAFQSDIRRNKGHVLNRLTAFCKGSKEQGKILLAPPQQFSQRHAHARHKVYRITAFTRQLLGPRASAVTSTASNSFVHDLMQACVAASLELTAPKHGLRWVPRSEFLLHDYSGSARTAVDPMLAPSGIKFDDVGALEHPTKGKRACLIEVDRYSESMDPRGVPTKGTTYFGHKLDAIDDLIASGNITRWLGVSKPYVLIVTTTGTRANQIIKRVERLKSAQCFYVTVVTEFADEPENDLFWRVPDHVLPLLDQPWLTVNGARLLTQ